MTRLTHLDDSGAARMVDVGPKAAQRREATASGFIQLQPATLDLIRNDRVGKGNVLAVARVAGIQAGKKTADLIPLCHQIPLSGLTIDFAFREDGIAISATARTIAPTGVEMEALTAVSLAALTIYDMCKAVDPAMAIGNVRLTAKSKSDA